MKNDAESLWIGRDSHWIFACGVDSPKSAKLVDNRAGAGITHDGSCVDNDEFHELRLAP